MSLIFDEEPFNNELYQEVYLKEMHTESFPDKEPTCVDQAAYAFLIHLLETIQEKDEPNHSNFLIVSYYRQVLDNIVSEDAWKDYVENWCPEVLAQFEQAKALLAPSIQKMEEHIKYGITDEYDLYQFEEVNKNQFNRTPWRIFCTTYHPEWEEEYQNGDRPDIVDTGYLADRYNRARRFATLQEARDFVKEYEIS